MNQETVLVTGGAGFIGSHVVDALIVHGTSVRVLDNLATGSLDNLAQSMENLDFICGDIRDPDVVHKAMEDVSIVFHLAAETSVSHAQAHQYDCYETNVIGTMNVLQEAQRCGVQRVVFASSAAVYGNQALCSELSECNPISAYGTSKLIGEQLCTYFYEQYDMTTTALRFFNVYGPRQQGNGLTPSITAHIRQCMMHNKPIIIYGDGTQKRDFVPVQLIVETVLAIAESPAHTIAGQIFNVATGKSMSVLELITQMQAEYPNYELKLEFKPNRVADIYESFADCSKLNNVIHRFVSVY